MPRAPKTRPEGYVPRSRNSFIIFRSHKREQILADALRKGIRAPTENKMSCDIGDMWKKLPTEQKGVYVLLAEKERHMHRVKYALDTLSPERLEQSALPTERTRSGPREVPFAESAMSTSAGVDSHRHVAERGSPPERALSLSLEPMPNFSTFRDEAIPVSPPALLFLACSFAALHAEEQHETQAVLWAEDAPPLPQSGGAGAEVDGGVPQCADEMNWPDWMKGCVDLWS